MPHSSWNLPHPNAGGRTNSSIVILNKIALRERVELQVVAKSMQLENDRLSYELAKDLPGIEILPDTAGPTSKQPLESINCTGALEPRERGSRQLASGSRNAAIS